jgi:hypothetical protein
MNYKFESNQHFQGTTNQRCFACWSPAPEVGGKGYEGMSMILRDGDVASVISPVPEPQTYAMLLAGLSMIGFMSSRRKDYNFKMGIYVNDYTLGETLKMKRLI